MLDHRLKEQEASTPARDEKNARRIPGGIGDDDAKTEFDFATAGAGVADDALGIVPRCNRIFVFLGLIEIDRTTRKFG